MAINANNTSINRVVVNGHEIYKVVANGVVVLDITNQSNIWRIQPIGKYVLGTIVVDFMYCTNFQFDFTMSSRSTNGDAFSPKTYIYRYDADSGQAIGSEEILLKQDDIDDTNYIIATTPTITYPRSVYVPQLTNYRLAIQISGEIPPADAAYADTVTAISYHFM